MTCNGLQCRCGETNNWELSWSYTDTWSLYLECSCGALHKLGESNNERTTVLDLVNEPWKKVGRPKVVEAERVLELRDQGMNQEHIARELNVSLSTVRRCLKE